MAVGVPWYGHVLLKEGGQFLRRSLEFQVEGHRESKGGRGRWWNKVGMLVYVGKMTFAD